MIEENFWNLIDESRNFGQTISLLEQSNKLKELLNNFDSDELLDFVRLFEKQLMRAYTWDLWALPFIAYGGCSDGDFEEFRAWLISQGRDIFENALIDLDAIADLVKDHLPTEPIGEASGEFFMTPSVTYEKKYGRHPFHLLPQGAYISGGDEPSGRAWQYTELCDRFPRLCRLFNRSQEDFAEFSL